MPRDNQIISMAETCGMEFECDDLTSDSFSSFKDRKRFRFTHDASCETPKKYSGQLGFIIENRNDLITNLLPVSNVTVGTELVSEILNSNDDEFLDIIKNLTEFLTSAGESSTSDRSGIHFHFSLSNPNLRILKSIVRLGRHLECLFFTLGGMGYGFRGVKNDAVYCRPITKYGPPCVVRYHGGYSQVYDVKDLLKTKKLVEFWNLYGDLENHGGRYNPVRYSWLNLYPLSPYGEYRGTLEFRLFNKTLNPLFIHAIAILCKKFTEYSIASSFRTLKDDGFLKENSVFDDTQTKQGLSKQLLKFSELSEMDEDILQILMDILDRSPIPKLKKGFVHTHITRELNRYWQGSSYDPPFISADDIRKPKYVDIHTINESRR